MKYIIGCMFIIIIALIVVPNCFSAEVDMDIQAVIMAECSGDYSKIRKDEGAYGCMQIRQPALDDYNEYHMTNYKLDDMLKPDLGYTVGCWYINVKIPDMLDYYSIPDTAYHRLIAYNFGIGNLLDWYRRGAVYKHLPQDTKVYIGNYEKFKKVNQGKYGAGGYEFDE